MLPRYSSCILSRYPLHWPSYSSSNNDYVTMNLVQEYKYVVLQYIGITIGLSISLSKDLIISLASVLKYSYPVFKRFLCCNTVRGEIKCLNIVHPLV